MDGMIDGVLLGMMVGVDDGEFSIYIYIGENFV